MNQINPNSESTLAKLKAMPRIASYDEYLTLVPDYYERYQLSCGIPDNLWVVCERQTSLEMFLAGGLSTLAEVDAIARGHKTCPACGGLGRYTKVIRGGNKEIQNIFWEERIPCHCQGWKYLWGLVGKKLPARYGYVNIWTLKPDLHNNLPSGVQQREIDYFKKNLDDSYLLLGPSGTGKTTFSCALIRRAYERNFKHFWDNGKIVKYSSTQWIWHANFDLLLGQYNAKQHDMKDAPEPYVTVEKINAAKEAGFTPVLLIEEVDKTPMNEHREGFLFKLVDAMKNNEGQLIMTSNLPLDKFVKMLTAKEDTVTVGEPIIRRFLDQVHVRSYFE